MTTEHHQITIGELIRRERMAREPRMTQDALAELLNTTQASVVRWERGRLNPAKHRWPAIAEFLGMTADEVGRITAKVAEAGPPVTLSKISERIDRLREEMAETTGKYAGRLSLIARDVGYLEARVDDLEALTTKLAARLDTIEG